MRGFGTVVVGLAGALVAGLALAACHGSGMPPDVGYDLSAVAHDLATVRDASMRDQSDDDLGGPACDSTGSLGGVAGVSGDAGDGATLDGTWHFANGCGTGDALYELSGECATMTFKSVAVTDDAYGGPAFGVLTFAGGNAFTRSSHAGIVASVFAPTSCTMGAGNCASFASNLMTQFNWLDETICTTGAGGCDCTLHAQMSVSDNGSYTANGEAMAMQGQAGGAQQFAFGVDANELRIRGGATATRGSRGITYVLTR